jgi:uncharacterized glyoxalase superfamily protein PhnB
MVQPGDIGGAQTQTQTTYLVVDEDYGGRGFTCHDPEGHIWSIGSYHLWQAQA